MNPWLDIAKDLVGGRKWLVAVGVAVPGTKMAAHLRQLGAADVLVVAANRGTGPLAEGPEDRLVVLETPAVGFMESIRAEEACLSDLPAEVIAQVDAWDPEGAALARRSFFTRGGPVAGRRCHGARPEAWQALEDKTVIDALWDAADVERAPSCAVPVSSAAQVATELDEGRGTVWAGDSREGFNGGAAYTRWVRTREQAEQASSFFAPRCDRVRVMPFLAGIPCSIHGIVVPGEEHIIALRPMEMVVLQQGERFVYAGAGCSWRPAETVRDQMRGVARRVGAHLRDAYDYRGAFTVDGVVGPQGFRPTELNPRFGAAMKYYAAEDLPLDLLVEAMIEDRPYRWRAEALEAELLRRAEAPRACGSGVPLSVPCAEPDEFELEGASVLRGPWGAGTFVRVFIPEPEIGPPIAPRIAAVLAEADARWGLGLEGLAAAD